MASGDKNSLRFANEFVISCGTVSLDPAKSLVLLVRHRRTGNIYLPKGRKNVGESLEDAAVRETLEETGYSVQLRAAVFPTSATAPDPALPRPGATKEPIAVVQRMVRKRLKIIFWYLAEVDSTQTRRTDTQQEGEDFESVWAPFDEVGDFLTFDDDERLVQRAIAVLPRSEEEQTTGA